MVGGAEMAMWKEVLPRSNSLGDQKDKGCWQETEQGDEVGGLSYHEGSHVLSNQYHHFFFFNS